MVATDPIIVALDKCEKLNHLTFDEKFRLAVEILKQWELCSRAHSHPERNHEE